MNGGDVKYFNIVWQGHKMPFAEETVGSSGGLAEEQSRVNLDPFKSEQK